MKLQLWRNATLQLDIHHSTFLIDPMLGRKGSFGAFPCTEDKRPNPLVELPFSEEALRAKLKATDAVFVSHLHPDHWDEPAVRLLDKATPIICPEAIAGAMASYGFENILPLGDQLKFNEVELFLTHGQHGTGEIGEKMGPVNGVVFQHRGRKLYIAGDTIWCAEVKEAIDAHQPQHIIVAGGAATFAIGQPVTMTAQHIKALAAYATHATIWVTHLEAVSPCTENRAFLSGFLNAHRLQGQCNILGDGAEAVLTF